MKVKTITTAFILMIMAFLAGLYFKDHFFEFYERLGKQVKRFETMEIGSVVSQVGKQILTPPPLKVQGAEKEVSLIKSKIISATNYARQEDGGLPPLLENSRLNEAALAKAKDMFAKQYFEHVSPSGVDPGDLVQGVGYEYIIAGENLILGNFASEQEVVENWMASPGHKANILNKKYAEIGAAIIKGIYKGENVWIGVQEFGVPISACSSPDKNLKEDIDFKKEQLEFLYSELGESRNVLESARNNSPAYGQMVDNFNKLVEQYNELAQETKRIISKYNSQVGDFNICVSK